MAKKAKRAKRSPARAKGKTVTLDKVVLFVKRLHDLNQLDEFLEAVEGSKSFVTLRGRSHDRIKRFVEQKQAAATPGATALTAESGALDPCPKGFRCF